MNYAIDVRNVSKQFLVRVRSSGILGFFKGFFARKRVFAVQNVSFRINEGELVGFIGPNGAGKSTTIKMLTGILFPSSGEISVLNRNPQKERRQLAYNIGTIFGQRQQLLYHLPAIDSFNLFSKIYEIPEAEYRVRLKYLSSVFEIQDFMNVPVRKLSLGQRMRCELVASLLHKPKILFLDEPTIGMDILAKKSLRSLIRMLNEKESTTIILTSHDLDDIEELCSRVILINRGKILFDGSMENLRKNVNYKRVELYFDHDVKRVPVVQHVKVVERTPFKIVLHVDLKRISVRKVLSIFLQVGHVADIIIEDPPIEEVVERFYKS
jgi:ABC-2 type transport system ATP-binding protein